MATTLHLDLAIDSTSFAERLAREIVTGGLTVVDAIERLIVEHLEDSLAKTLGERLVRAPRVTVHPMYYSNRFENLYNLNQHGYSTSYPEVRFATRKTDRPIVAEIATSGFDLGYIRYGGGVERAFRHQSKELKTQVNHTVRLNKLSIPGEIFAHACSLIEQNGELEQPHIANLAVGFQNFVDDRIEGFRVVSFDHVTTGNRKFCGCHGEAHATMLLDARERAPSYVPDSWPHRVVSLLDSATYSDDLCHFCISRLHGEDAVSDWYGAQIQSHYGPYVDMLVRSTDMDIRTAKAEARRRLLISRWKREDELYRLIVGLFPTMTIRREASPPWLGRQRLDIYIPELKLAIEHQGEQHYRPIGAFGGEQAFARLQERDQRKRTLCQEHGVTVVDVRFDAPLTVPVLRLRLRRWLSK